MKPKNINEYMIDFPENTQLMLEQIRATIKKAAPAAEETIGYSMPAFRLNGRNLFYFAAYKNHIGFYPVPVGNKSFEKDFSMYKVSGRGTIQFPLTKPIPLGLITRIVKFKIKENAKKDAKR